MAGNGKGNGKNGNGAAVQEGHIMDSIRAIHGTTREIKDTVGRTHELTKQIHERVHKG